jgi:predicted RNase H-like HicB family nuclease
MTALGMPTDDLAQKSPLIGGWMYALVTPRSWVPAALRKTQVHDAAGSRRAAALAYYIGVLEKSGATYCVRIPDFPGVHGSGADTSIAIRDTIIALREVGAFLFAEGTPLPYARTLEEILADKNAAPDIQAGEIAVMIPVLADEGRSVKANISIDQRLLEAIDAEAKLRGLTRSGFLASAAIDKISRAG